MATSDYNYVRIEDPSDVEPGDIVYEVVRFGHGDTDIKHNEMRVMSVERRAVVALRAGGPRGSRPIKMPFTALVRRAPMIEERDKPAPIVLTHRMRNGARVTVRDVSHLEEQAPPPPPDAFAAYLEITQGLVQELRTELDGLDARKAELEKKREALGTTHRQEVDLLNERLRCLNHAHQKRDVLLLDEIEQLEQKRQPLTAKVDSIESMIAAVRAS